ncbi:MAG: hypothetical protein JXR23_04115 [Pontiellaceae bacterium]|nr:hypothetical protein [Pontiellaceae bacterium]
MKKIIGVILMLVAVNSFAGKIPEAKSLHPELYTIQFTYLHFDSGIAATTGEYEKQANQEFWNLLEESYDEEEIEEARLTRQRDRLKARIKDLQSFHDSYDGEYTELATVYTRAGESFPEAYSNVVNGLLDLESNTLVIEYFFSKSIRVRREHAYDDFSVNEWRAVTGSVRADVESDVLFVKCYPPTNLSSSQKLDPAVKMSGDPVSEQDTAAERYTIQVTCLNYYELEYCEKEGLLTESQLNKLEEIKDEMRREIEKHQNLLEDLVDEEEIEEAESLHRWRMQALDIKRAEVLKQGYSEIATIYTSPGKPFSGEYGIKGILDVASNKIIFTDDNDLFGGKDSEFPIYVNEWSYIANSIRGINRSYLLVKYYPSANVPSIQTSE